MTRDEWRVAEPVLTKAVLLPDADRRALLDSAGLSQALHREILEVLRAATPVTRRLALAQSGGASASSGGQGSLRTPVLTPGDALDGRRFVIVRQVGRGGMGAVYLAQDTTLGTLVALKIVPADERLIQEARRAAACSGHEHIATVHNVLQTEHGGQQIGVLVMEYVPGQPASRVIEDGPIDMARALRWMRQVAAGVAHAHECEVLHCDLKPANLIVTRDDRVKVLDFGIARASFDAANPAEPARGTLPYMAPEQITDGEFSRAGDVYSLGVTLFEMLAGRRPFEGDEATLPLQILAAPAPRLRELRSEVPRDVEELVDRALSKDPEKRIRSARAFERAIEEAERRTATVVPQPARTAGWWTYAGGIVAAVLGLSVVLGLIACRAFEVVLRVDSAFYVSAADYFRVGREALIPFVLYWIFAAAIAGAFAGVTRMIRWWAPQRWTALTTWGARWNPTGLAVGTLLLGVAGWLALTWVHRDLFAAMFDLHQSPESAAVGTLSFASRPRHTDYAVASAYLSFLLVAASFWWFPRLQRRTTDPAAIRVVTWATAILTVVVMLGPTVPRRFVFERFRVVEYQGQQALEIAGNTTELLLYDSDRRVSLRTRRDAPTLAPTTVTRQIFER